MKERSTTEKYVRGDLVRLNNGATIAGPREVGYVCDVYPPDHEPIYVAWAHGGKSTHAASELMKVGHTISQVRDWLNCYGVHDPDRFTAAEIPMPNGTHRVVTIGPSDPGAGRIRETPGLDQWAARGTQESYSAAQAAADQASMYRGGQNDNAGILQMLQGAGSDPLGAAQREAANLRRRVDEEMRRAEAAEARANQLSDACGDLDREVNDLHVSLSKAERKIEKLEKRRV